MTWNYLYKAMRPSALSRALWLLANGGSLNDSLDN